MSAAHLRKAGAILGAVCAVGALITGSANAADPSGSAPQFTGSVTATRDHLVDGADDVVDSRKVTATASVTRDLRDRQGITVTWSGAPPTGNIAPDPNSLVGAYEEYPVVVIQCRGVDSTSVPAKEQVSPQTCFTQTPIERFASSSTISWPSYRMDRYATQAERGFNVNQPSPLPTGCPSLIATHWIPLIGADGTSYPGGYQGCAGIAPDQAISTAALQPASTTYGVSDLTGNGSTQFIIQSNLSNASLGCSSTVKCTLEVIPVEGISCDAAGTAPAPGGMPVSQQPPTAGIPTIQGLCASTGNVAAGSVNSVGQPDSSPVSGVYWWSASNWRNRIAVPLTFAEAADVCNTVSTGSTAYVYGAEAMLQATQQWAPSFCLDPKLFSLRHVQTSETEAKSLLAAGTVQAAFQAAPPDTPFTTPTVQAPTAITGWAIAAVVDGADGRPYHVTLDARLLAKLMTESYEACAQNCLAFDELASNPADVTHDPEFRALNPGIPDNGNLAAAAALTLISSNSDVIHALTSYINDDPEARAWLDGKPDPWGTVVNPAYRGIDLPVDSWPLLDTHLAQVGSANLCLADSPTPWLPLVASPVENPALIALNLQYDIANSQVGCSDGGQPDEKLVAEGRQVIGTRFLLGLVSLADAVRYDLPTAALETHRASDSNVVFGDSTGRTFVDATDASLKAAATLLKPDDDVGSWPIPYDTMRTSDAGKAAYPGIMLISTDVPTSGLSKTDADDYAKLLRFAAGPGQTAGLGNGELPPGYLPLTAGNGVGALVSFTKAAATAVAAQQCVLPHPSGAAAAAPSCNLPKSPSSPTPSVTTSSGATLPPSGPTPSVSTSAPSSSSPPSPTPSTSTSAAPVATGRTTKIGAGFLGLVLPLIALIGLVGLVLSGGLTQLGGRRRR